jgi:molybdate transport system substrate-binding protein
LSEIKTLISPGFVPVMHDLATRFANATGHTLAVSSDRLGAIVKRVEGGENLDVVLGPRTAIDDFVKDGKAAAGSLAIISRSPMIVTVRDREPKPDISSPAALRRTLLAARSIAYPDPENRLGNVALGIHFSKVLERLQISKEVQAKAVFSMTVDIGDLVANGEAEIGISQRQNLMRCTGLQIVGELPGDLHYDVAFAAVVMNGADCAASTTLLNFLRSPDAAAAIEAAGMDQVTP